MARTKADIRTTYDRIAESYAARRRVPWPEVRSFIDSLPRGSRVLDLGAGHGRHATILADRGHRAVALDFSRRLLLIGRADEPRKGDSPIRSEEHTSELQSPCNLVCRLLLEKKKKNNHMHASLNTYLQLCLQLTHQLQSYSPTSQLT